MAGVLVNPLVCPHKGKLTRDGPGPAGRVLDREAVVDGETGYLVEARDHEAMARQILRLLDAPQRARAMGILGQQIVKQKFSSEAQVKAIAALYERLLPAPNGARLYGGEAAAPETMRNE